jgi:hypothetical protein
MIFLRKHSFTPWKLSLVCLINSRIKALVKIQTRKNIKVMKYDGGEEYV